MSLRIPKSVSITRTVNDLIDFHFPQRGQFSAFVRAAVLDHDERVTAGGGPHSPMPGLDICNGMRRPTCSICYPDGPPSQEAWLKFVAEASGDRTGRTPMRDGKIELHYALKELHASIEEPPIRPRVDEVTRKFPEKLTFWAKLRKKLSI